MKHFYPRVLENKEPLFQLRALAGADLHAGNVCHAVAPPGVGYTSPCHLCRGASWETKAAKSQPSPWSG